MTKKIMVDAACNMTYAAYYIYGLECFFGQKVKYSSRAFKELGSTAQYLAVIIKEKHKEYRLVIDHDNSPKISEIAYEWCHLYGKINLDISDQWRDKVFAIGPSMAIRIYPTFQTYWLGGTNLIRAYRRITQKKQFLSNYLGQLQRPEISQYEPETEEENHLFFMSSLWKKESKINDIRANYILACKSFTHINFEGGFAPRTRNDIPGYEDLSTEQRIDPETYLKKTKKSLIAFNTPSVKHCNGWRLAEYLCLGKCILSLPLVRLMPAEFENGVHIYFADGSLEDFQQKLSLLLSDRNKRTELADNARKYYLSYLQPEAVIRRIYDQLNAF